MDGNQLAPADDIGKRWRTADGTRPDRWVSRGSPEARQLASRDPLAYAEWFRWGPTHRYFPDRPEGPDGPHEIRGLILRGRRGSTGLPVDNPWGLPVDGELDRLIRYLWAPAAEYLPAFVDRLVRSTFAIGVIREDGMDYLGYLRAAWVSRDVPDVGAVTLEELMEARELTVCIAFGAPPLPLSDKDIVPALGEPMPAPLRAVARAHRRLVVLEDTNYIDLESLETYADFLGAEDDHLPEGRYVAFAGQTDYWSLLDLDVRDGSGHPTVVFHDAQSGLELANRERLVPFLDHELVELVDLEVR